MYIYCAENKRLVIIIIFFILKHIHYLNIRYNNPDILRPQANEIDDVQGCLTEQFLIRCEEETYEKLQSKKDGGGVICDP